MLVHDHEGYGKPEPEIYTPHNIEAEQALLGVLLVDNGLADQISDTLTPESFYDGVHGRIYAEAMRLIAAGTAATPVSLKTVFGEELVLPELPYWQYLGRLVAHAPHPSPQSAANLARQIDDLATRRILITIGGSMVDAAMNQAGMSTQEQIEEAEKALFKLAERGIQSRELPFHIPLEAALQTAHDAHVNGGAMAGQPTGYRDLDDKLGGLQSSDLIILGGRPAMGKTALATNLAYNVAKGTANALTGEIKHGHVHFFSMEMSAEQLAMRVLGEQSSISSDRLRRGQFGEHEYRVADAAKQAMRNLPITIDETGGITLAQLAQRARRLKRKRDTKLIVIDYLQLMQAGGKRENRTQELTQITMGLKTLAKELRTPILCLSQLSRDVEKRADKRPQQSDLRESGSIEQDADVIMFVYRDEYYLSRDEPDINDTTKYAEWQQKMTNSQGTAEVIICKHRHGPTGIVRMGFDASLTQFKTIDGGHGYAKR